MGTRNTVPPGISRLRPVFETALDAVVAMWPDGTVAEWNAVAERTFGWTREEAVGRQMAELIVPPQLRAAHTEGLRRFNATGHATVLGSRLEITAIDRDEREFPVELSITANGTGGERLFIGFLRDVRSRKAAEDKLLRQARQSELLFQLSRFASESETVEPVLREALKAICELTGWPVGHALVVHPDNPDEAVSSDIWFGEPDDVFENLRKVTLSTRFTRGAGLPGVILRSGEPEWMSDTETDTSFLRKGLGFGAAFGFPVRSEGRVIAILEFFTHEVSPPDPALMMTVRTLGEQVGRVLERTSALIELRSLNESLEARVLARSRELEAAHESLRQAQKMEAIGQLTGGIAHDFNNLLTVIRGSADLLRRSDLREERRQQYVDAISDTADRAARLTGQLLAFARRQALKPIIFDTAACVANISDMLRTILGSRVQLVIDAECSDCLIEADQGQFETALVNLAVNARDAMDGEGKLTLTLVRTESSDRKGAVRVSVSDSGHGIAPDHLAHIFEPFFTTKEVGRGTGLGLSQVYGFVKQSEGDISVESEVGFGTTFILTFPGREGARVPDHATEISENEVGRGTRILVVEDNADVGRFASELLTDLGYETTLASNAAEALDMLEDPNQTFDLVFSDVVMPGMDGVTFGRTVNEKWPSLPVVLASGYSEVLAAESGHGFPLLHKPYSAESLSRALRGAYRRAG